MTSPIVRCFKLQKEVEIHYLTKESMAPLLLYNPYIDHIHGIKNAISEKVDELKALDFDLVIDLHKNIRSKRLISKLKKPSTTFDKLNIEKWLLVNFKIDRLPSKHLVDRYFEGVSTIGLVNDGEGLDHFVTKEGNEFGDRFRKEHGPYQILVLGANYYTKRIPIFRLEEILKDNLSQKFILIGGKDVVDEGRELESYSNVSNQCGRLSLDESAAIIKYSDHVFTGDTGMMHIAAAFKKPITSIWGNTVPRFGMYPYFGNHQVESNILEVSNLSCRPCSKLGFDQCPKGHFKCMKGS